MDIETIPAGKFKAQCLKLMDEVSQGKRSFIITKHGKPVAKVVPPGAKKKMERAPFGFMKGTMEIRGDIVSPMPEVWNLPE